MPVTVSGARRRLALIRAGVLLGLATMVPVPALAAGMRVQPGGALLQNLPPGERHKLRASLAVFNDDSEPHSVALSAHKPSEINARCPAGYSDIPDPGWFTFSSDTVEVPANGHTRADMFIHVPAEEKYKNQHWSVSIAVRSKPEKGQMLTLAIYPRFEIETVSDPEPKAPPAGDLTITPGVAELSGVGPGTAPAKGSVRVWNNTDGERRFTARVLARPAEGEKSPVALTGGYIWLPDAAWVKLEGAEAVVEAGGSTAVTFDVTVPEDKKHYGAVWETVLLVEFEDGQERFGRLRISTAADG